MEEREARVNVEKGTPHESLVQGGEMGPLVDLVRAPADTKLSY
jgi:hypothetical protein